MKGDRKTLTYTFFFQNITISYKPIQTFKQYSNLKSPILFNKISHLIYELPCNNCDNNYIDLTIQYQKN